MRLSWLPFLLVIAGTATFRFYFPDIASGGADSESFSFRNLGPFLEIVIWFATIPLATAWTRLILLQQDNTQHPVSLRLRREEAVYLGQYVVLLLAILALIVAPFGIAAALLPANEAGEMSDAIYFLIFFVLLVVAVIVSFVIFVPNLLVLPAAASGQPSSFRNSRRLSKGNIIRIGLILVFALAPELLEVFLTDFEEEASAPADDEAWSDTLLAAIQEFIISWLFFTISIASLALIYKRLVGEPGGETTAPAAAA